MKKNDPALATALAALTTLIKATLDTDDPGRFAVAARMCGNAHAFLQETGTRAEDFDEDMGVVQAQRNPVIMRAAHGRAIGPNGQMWGDGDVMRETLGSVLPLLDRLQGAQAEASEARTLSELLAARDGLTPEEASVVNVRIASLVQKIRERNQSNALVSAVVLRGHQPGDHDLGLSADSRAAHAEGAGGDPPAPEAGPEVGPNHEAMGHVG